MPAAAEVAFGSEERLIVSQAPPPPSDSSSDFQTDVKELAKMFSKLNPSAKEFVPSSQFHPVGLPVLDVGRGARTPDVSDEAPSGESDCYGDSIVGDSNGNYPNKKANRSPGRRRRINQRLLKAQREDTIRRTVYVSDIAHQVTEEILAGLFSNYGQVLDCRICGDPYSFLRFAFVEFADETSAKAALELCGTLLGYYPLRVLPSKTAILPVNPTFLPQSEYEKEMCTRTIYCTNIDSRVSQLDIKVLFERFCGRVSRLRLLADQKHTTFSAFVEFVLPESALMALNCSGMLVGGLPIRVSPSKTPVRSGFPQGKQQQHVGPNLED